VHHINHGKRVLRKGTLVLVTDTDIHAFSADTGKTLLIANLAFPRRLWKEVCTRYFPDEKDPMQLPVAAREISLRHEDFLTLERQSQRLKSASRSRARLDLFLLEILFLMRHPTVLETPRPAVPDWLNAACEGIKKTELLPQGLKAFYRIAGRSPDHVARACRAHLGVSPTEVVNAARLEFAATRLCGTDDPILEVAHDCGLPNLAHFYKLFVARFGTTPRRYRLQARLIVGRLPRGKQDPERS
jgi:AraC family cel operon transcriptional repressor